jgi:hypothetical protein
MLLAAFPDAIVDQFIYLHRTHDEKHNSDGGRNFNDRKQSDERKQKPRQESRRKQAVLHQRLGLRKLFAISVKRQGINFMTWSKGSTRDTLTKRKTGLTNPLFSSP